jgi:hypothetical protein
MPVIRDWPDLAPGRDKFNVEKGDLHQWFDPTAFEVPCIRSRQDNDPATTGCFGNAGRNYITADNLIGMDFSLFKGFSLGESRNLQFRAEAFNLPNHPNFGTPNSTVFTNITGVPFARAGEVTSTTGTPRLIQLGLKLEF